jgi:hypothetical protein
MNTKKKKKKKKREEKIKKKKINPMPCQSPKTHLNA